MFNLVWMKFTKCFIGFSFDYDVTETTKVVMGCDAFPRNSELDRLYLK